MDRIAKDAKISGLILANMISYKTATGATDQEALKWAFDKVLGVAAYDCLASEVYDELVAA